MRTQFYDPFGMRTQGYRAGIQDEMQIQDQTRRADQFDWERANMRPLQLRAANRVEDYNQYADPFMRNQLRGADYDADIARAGNFGLRTGNYAPAMNTDFSYFVPQAQELLPEMAFYQNMQDGSMGFTTPDGRRAPLQFNTQNYADANRLLTPALSTYDQFLASLMSNNNQFDATLQQNAAQQANSLGWLELERRRAMGGSPGSNMGLIPPGWNGWPVGQ